MAKKILDRFTIQRLLDGMDKEQQRKLVLNAFKNCQTESAILIEERTQLLEQFYPLLNENPWDVTKIVNILIELEGNQQESVENSIELKNVRTRTQFINGLISKEEMQQTIKDNIMADEKNAYTLEYRYRLMDLLAREPDTTDLKLIEEIRNLKIKSLELKNHSECKYPNE